LREWKSTQVEDAHVCELHVVYIYVGKNCVARKFLCVLAGGPVGFVTVNEHVKRVQALGS
jgi:hypothetical protein